ncbi:MAG TPA: hypothetical protein VN791_04685 [Acidimicrobiales bacterium]|nr:hypothetical protein [Acidimicrobiales bacterium]
MAATGATAGETCDSCGGPGDRLEEVRRIYVTIDDGGRVTASETVDRPERWCLSCRSLYPHRPAGPDPGPPPPG